MGRDYIIARVIRIGSSYYVLIPRSAEEWDEIDRIYRSGRSVLVVYKISSVTPGEERW